MNRADKILSRIDLDPVHAVQLRFAYSRAREPRRVDVLVFRESVEKAERLIVGIVVAGAWIDRLPDNLHARALHDTGVDRIAEIDRVESAARVHIRDRREAGLEIELSI